MATTQNTYTGNGSTVLYSFTFPYLATTDIKVSVNGTNTTAYTLANATTVQFTAAPANGAAIRIFRTTDDSQIKATFFPGSSIRAQNLNDNFTQNLYVTQEANNVASSATTVSNSALAASASATSTANTSLSNSTAAVTTANTASTNAAAAVSTSNAASTTATTALSNSSTALSTANTALSTANSSATQAATALTNSATALSQSNTALTQSSTAVTSSSSAVTTANTASSNASTALSNSSSAVTTANTANTKADQAISAVSNSINYTLIGTVAGIPASPANDTYVEVGNSTGIESFTPLAGKPAGFVGDSGLSVRIRYTTAGATWNWQNYYPNNAETRYLKLAGGTLTGDITLAGAPSSNLHPATKLYTDTAVGAKLDTATAASTYQTQAGMSSYLTTASASSTYLSQSSASSTYLPTATAASTYQTQAGMASYLTTATAGTTYQTQAGMASYLTTTAAGSTYQPLSGMSSYAALGTAQSFTKAQRGTPVALTDAATVAVDLSLSNHYTLALGGNRTLGAPTNQTAGQSGVIVITNGGANTLAFASVWKFPGGTAPTVTASAVDVLAYYVESSTRITARIVSDVK